MRVLGGFEIVCMYFHAGYTLKHRRQSLLATLNILCKPCKHKPHIQVDHVEIKEFEKRKVPGYEAPVEFGVLTSFAYRLMDPFTRPGK